jgi:NhaA family Na+:H+ antiporter
LAGVAVAFFIPLKPKTEGAEPLLKHLEHMLHPWVAFSILPFFAFANAGVSLDGLTPSALFAPVPLGIAAGLFIGKQLGVFGFTYGAVRLGLARMPEGVSWLQIYGLSFLTGIGFTMSLFIGTLAFDEMEHATGLRLGVLIGSLLSAVGGYVLLRMTSPSIERTSVEAELQRS